MNTLASGENVQSKSENGSDIEKKLRVMVKPTTIVERQTGDSVGKSKPSVDRVTTSLAHLNTIGANENKVQTIGGRRESSPITDVFDEPACCTAVKISDTKFVEKMTTETHSVHMEGTQIDRNHSANTLSSSPVEAMTAVNPKTEINIGMPVNVKPRGHIFYSKNFMKALCDEAARKKSTKNVQPKSDNGSDLEKKVRVVAEPTTVIEEPTDNFYGKSKTSLESQMVSMTQIGSVDTNENKILTSSNPKHTAEDIAMPVNMNPKGHIFYSKRFMKALRDEAKKKRSTDVENPVTIRYKPKAPKYVEEPSTVIEKPKSQIECNKPQETLAVVDAKEDQPIAVDQYLTTTTIENNEPQNACDVELKDNPVDPLPEDRQSDFRRFVGICGRLLIKEVVCPQFFELTLSLLKW